VLSGRTTTWLAMTVALSALTLSACGTDNNTVNTPGGASGTTATASAAAADCPQAALTGAGSSFQSPMQQQWSADYLGRCAAVRVNYNSVGSGAGIQQFTQGTVDFAGSDVAMKPEEQRSADERCAPGTAIHVPVTAGGVAVTYNVAGVKELKLSPMVLAGIFQGTITRWDDAAVKQVNPDAALPGDPIVVFHRSDGSGTTAVFSAYLSAAAAASNWKLGAGKTLTWPVGQGAKGNEGVSAGVAQTKGAITYTEQAFAEQKQLPTALIGTAAGQFVALNATNVSAALESATVVGTGHDVTVKVDFAPSAAQAYPISTVSYVIACDRYPSTVSADSVKAIKGYLTYALGDGQKAAAALGFAPLPSSLLTKATAAVEAITVG
jgi:phosphate transport system substrate-binding protein